MKLKQFFRIRIKSYYKNYGRDFFWRRCQLTPYQIMLVELFLQKTKAENAEKTIRKFIKNNPTNKILLKKSRKQIFIEISMLGLGNQRTRTLTRISTYLYNKCNNRFPSSMEQIRSIPGLGIYTTNAIMCFAFGKNLSILDVNTSRIIARFFGLDNSKDLRRNLKLQWKAESIIPKKNIREYNWGLLDLGSKICKPQPLCNKCPLRNKCGFFKKNRSNTSRNLFLKYK